MRRAVLLILAVCFLTSITRQGFSEKPLRLFFEKSIDAEAKPGEEHTVEKGEWLFKILAAKGYTGSQIQQMMPALEALNPHIPDMDRLMPGQVIHIPDIAAGSAPAPVRTERRPAPAPAPDSYTRVPYVVRAGDTLVEVLQAQGVPVNVIYGSYLDLFLELNPDIPDTNSLRAGQEVILPALPGSEGGQAGAKQGAGDGGNATAGRPAGTGSAKAAGTARAPAPAQIQPAPQPPRPAPEKPSTPAPSTGQTTDGSAQTRTPRTGLPLVKSVLEEMRFRFVPGDESMFPLPDGAGWLHVKMSETPLVDAPWGGKILFCPVPKSSSWVEGVNKLKMKLCTVSGQWGLQDVLEKLAAACPDTFRLWSPARDLVLPAGGVTLTLQSSRLALIEHGGGKRVYMLWARQTSEEPPLPQDLPELLDQAQVKVIELDAFNEPSRLPARPKSSIYVPTATTLEVIRAINPDRPEELFGETLPSSLTELLQLLRDKSMLQQGMAQASWYGGQGGRISVQVPAWTVSVGASRVALLDRRFADPYLVSVLSQGGYSCFILPD